MSPGERAAPGRREPARPHYGTTAPGFPPHYYPPYGMPHPNAWLGAPLISMAGRVPPARHTPVAKLAMHAQGAPLIIQNRQERRKYANVPEQRSHKPLAPADRNLRDGAEPADGAGSRAQHQPRAARHGRGSNTDAVSVASDESSGSTNSETTLPRIIKPRKRRKKDRKPNNIMPHDLTAPALELGEVDHYNGPNVSTVSRRVFEETYCRDSSSAYRLDSKVSALGEALEATRFGIAEAVSPSESAVSSCQCRYCDPVGQIWDSESIADSLDENSSGEFAPTKLEESMKVVGPLGGRGPEAALRRSWSDPSSRAPDRREANAPDALSAPNLYSLFPPARTSSPGPRSPLALEISSEIVTSINGHRDLEIKLFSSSPPASTSDRRTFFAGKSESVVNGCTLGVCDGNASGAVNSDPRESGETPRDVCDVALITVRGARDGVA